MTKQEKIIVSAYTGVLMCDFDDVHEYIQRKLGRPVYTHELAGKGIQKEVKEKSHEDFLEICNREEPEQNWIPCSERLPEDEYVLISKKPSMISGDKWSVAIAVRMADQRSGKIQWRDSGFGVIQDDKVLAWMPLPPCYKGE